MAQISLGKVIERTIGQEIVAWHGWQYEFSVLAAKME